MDDGCVSFCFFLCQNENVRKRRKRNEKRERIIENEKVLLLCGDDVMMMI